MPEMKTLAYYESLKYPIEILEDDDAYVASIPDLPGCVAYGDTMQEAVASLSSVKRLWFEGRLEAGLAIPEPAELDEYSGKFVLRITRGLHKSLQREAQRQGVSLNQYIGQILAERHKLVNIDHVVQDAISKCLSRSDPSCVSMLAFWNIEETPTRISSEVSRISISHSNDEFTESFEALVGERQRKSYQLVVNDDPYYETKRTGNAPKKTKAHAHHC
jgi:antitoxin HicB